MATIYHLGWPGMELLPCIVVDQKTREMYHKQKPLPASKVNLLCPENKYVEFAKVLSFFELSKQQEAMNTFMSISSDYSVRKFFMDNNQKAYISVDTLLVYVMVYPRCPAFERARKQTLNYLQEWLDYPCLECGFIKRSGCLCTDDNPCDGEKTEYVGFCTEQVDRQIQTDPAMMPPPPSHLAQLMGMHQKPPNPPIMPTFMPPGAHGIMASVTPSMANAGPLSSSRIATVMPQVSGVAPQANVQPLDEQNAAAARSLLRAPPVQAVAPMLPVKPKMRDVGIQTRANFDFTPRNRRKTKVNAIEDEIPGSAPALSTGQNKESEANKSAESTDATPSSSSTTPSLPFPLPVSQGGGAQKDPIKVSLWKLLDSDSSDDEDEQKRKKKKDEQNKNDDEKKKETETEKVKEESEETKTQTSKDEAEETISESTKTQEVENPKYQEAPLSNAKELVGTSLLEEEEKESPEDEPKDKPSTSETAASDKKEVQESETSATLDKTEESDISVNRDEIVTSTETGSVKPDSDSKEPESVEADPESEQTSDKREDASKEKETSQNEETPEAMEIDSPDKTTITTKPVFVVTNEPSASTSKAGEESISKEDDNEKPMDEERPLEIDLTAKDEDKEDNNSERPEVKAEESKSSDKTEKESEESESKEDTPSKEDDRPKDQFKKWFHKFEYVPTQEKLFRCTFKRCGQCFDTRAAAELHNRVHGVFGQENPNNLTCYKCKYLAPLSRWFDMVRHLKEQHNELISADPLGCQFCGRVMETEEALVRHMDFHYMGRYKCIYCGTLGFTWKQMESHMDTACELRGKREKHLGCPYCPLVFHLRNMRTAHMMAHTDKGLCCTFCKDSNIWDNWTELRKHYQQKHGDKIKSALQPHPHSNRKVTKHGDKIKSALHPQPHPNRKVTMNIQKNPMCHVCSHESKTLEDYIYHMRKKHDFIPYVLSQCDVCEKTFKSEKMYDWHMKHTHGNEVRCPKCDFTARNDMQLKVHDERQHQAKEYECTECGKEFQFYHQLRMHLAHHALHTIYNCKECGAEFKRQKDLRAHVKKDHPKDEDSNRHKCPDCDFDTFTKRSLEMHIKRNHPKLAEEIAESETHAVPATPDHGYFNTKVSPPEQASPSRASRVPKPALDPDEKPAERQRPAVTLGKGKRGKKKKKWMYKQRAQVAEDTGDTVVDPVLSEKRRLRMEMREKIEKLKARVKESAVRTRTYEENRDLKQLKKRKHDQEEAGQNTTVAEDEPEQKRQRFSKYGRSLSVKTFDDDDVYIPTPKNFSERPRRRRHSRGEHARPRPKAGEGVAPPEAWDDEDNTVYPYTDHCYFSLELSGANIQHSSEYSKLVEKGRFSPDYSNLRRRSRDGDADWAPDPDAPSTSRQSYRISRGQISGGRHGRGQKYASQPHRRKQRFLPLQPDPRLTHDVLTIHTPTQEQPAQSRDDMTFDELDNELIREVSQDPLLQGIIDSMDQQQVHGQESPNKAYAPGGQHSQAQQQQQGLIAQARHAMPPSSLNLNASVSQVLPPVSPPATPARPGTSGAAPNPAAGLTPTKQSVIDLLLSKIELNEDQLNKLIEEQNKTEVSGTGMENPQGVRMENPQNLISQGVSEMRNQGVDLPEGDVLSLEQLASGNIASITRIDSNQRQPGPASSGGPTPMITQSSSEGHTSETLQSEGNATPSDDAGVATEMEADVGSDAGQQSGAHALDTVSGAGLGDVPIANEEVRVHAGSDTDSNPDLEAEMAQCGVVPPPDNEASPEAVMPAPAGVTLTPAEGEPLIDVTSVPLQHAMQQPEVRLLSSPIQQETRAATPPALIGQPSTGPASSSAQAQYRAITMSDGRGGTVRKLVKLVSKEAASSASQSIQSQILGESGMTDAQLGPSMDTMDIGNASAGASPVLVSGSQVVVSGAEYSGISGLQVGGVSGSQVVTSGTQIISSGGQRVIQQQQPAATTTRIIRRVVTGAPPQQPAARRVVQMMPSQPQAGATASQPRRIIVGPRPPGSVNRYGGTSASNLIRVASRRGRPTGPQPRVITTTSAGRPPAIIRTAAPHVTQIRSGVQVVRCSAPPGQARVGAPQVRFGVPQVRGLGPSGLGSPSARVVQISVPSNSGAGEAVTSPQVQQQPPHN